MSDEEKNVAKEDASKEQVESESAETSTDEQSPEENEESSGSKLGSIFKLKNKDGSRNYTGLIIDGVGVVVVIYLFLSGTIASMNLNRFVPLKEETVGTVIDYGDAVFVGSDEDKARLGNYSNCRYYTDFEYEINGRSYTGTYYSRKSLKAKIGSEYTLIVNAVDLTDVVKVIEND